MESSHNIYLYVAPTTRPNDSAATRRLLQFAWRDLFGNQEMPQVVVGPSGKPDFTDSIHFSLSHSKAIAAVALADGPVGVDVEMVRTCHPRLFRRVLTATEQEVVNSAPDKDSAFLTFWTLKEAYVKYTGCGLKRFPNDISFSTDNDIPILDGRDDLAFGVHKTSSYILAWCANARSAPGPIRVVYPAL